MMTQVQQAASQHSQSTSAASSTSQAPVSGRAATSRTGCDDDESKKPRALCSTSFEQIMTTSATSGTCSCNSASSGTSGSASFTSNATPTSTATSSSSLFTAALNLFNIAPANENGRVDDHLPPEMNQEAPSPATTENKPAKKRRIIRRMRHTAAGAAASASTQGKEMKLPCGSDDVDDGEKDARCGIMNHEEEDASNSSTTEPVAIAIADDAGGNSFGRRTLQHFSKMKNKKKRSSPVGSCRDAALAFLIDATTSLEGAVAVHQDRKCEEEQDDDGTKRTKSSSSPSPLVTGHSDTSCVLAISCRKGADSLSFPSSARRTRATASSPIPDGSVVTVTAPGTENDKNITKMKITTLLKNNKPPPAHKLQRLPAIQEEDEDEQEEDHETAIINCCPDGEQVAQVAVVQGSAALHAYASAKADSTGGILSLACIPVIVPFSMPYENVIDFFPLNDRATKFQKTLIVLTMTQGTVSLVQLLLGDLLGGFLGGVMATCGSYATSPQGIAWLPTYTVLSFLNGSVAALSLLEKIAFSKFAFLSLTNPFAVNFVHAVVLAAPVCSFAGVYYSHQLLKELRAMHSASGSLVDTSLDITQQNAALAGGLASSSTPGALPGTEMHRSAAAQNLVPFSGRPHTIVSSSGEDQ
ncbi:unnamed protein product [Amoebophrya sp. A120]|nr:unnamed protein product [Amoebophrya sp. A120]|eukprot:GSA120T00009196001.1